MSVKISAQQAKQLGIEVPKGKAQGQAGGMNQTESRFAKILWAMMHAGEILDYAFEDTKFRMAKRTWFTPDFRVTLPDHRNVFVEVKASNKNGSPRITDDGAVKIKTVPEHHPHAFFLAVCGRDGWTITRLPSSKWNNIEVNIAWAV